MKSLVMAVALMVGLGAVRVAQAQSWQPPADGQRCPSKWGAGDQRGSGNHMKPESVLGAAMPISGTRRFDVHTTRTFMNS